jgi:hypothetical protein
MKSVFTNYRLITVNELQSSAEESSKFIIPENEIRLWPVLARNLLRQPRQCSRCWRYHVSCTWSTSDVVLTVTDIRWAQVRHKGTGTLKSDWNFEETETLSRFNFMDDWRCIHKIISRVVDFIECFLSNVSTSA